MIGLALSVALPSPDPSATEDVVEGNPVTDRPCGIDDETLCGFLYRQFDNRTAAQVVDFLIGAPLVVLGVVIGAVVVRRLAHRVINRSVNRIVEQPKRRGRLDILDISDPLQSERRVQRAKAIGSLLRAVVSVVIWVFAVLLILPQFAINVTGLVAGAGIVGLALAFGAQTLISDLVSGIFMIAEDQYGVGDVIDMGEASGVVEAVGLRTTRLRAVDGTVWHVRNGEVTRVGNMSQGWSRALMDIEVAYQEDVTYVMDVISRVGHELRMDAEFGPKILEEPEMWGVEAFGANSVVIRMIIKTQPLEQWKVAREMRRRLKHEFDRLGIEIPFPQRSVWVRTEGPDGGDGEGAESGLGDAAVGQVLGGPARRADGDSRPGARRMRTRPEDDGSPPPAPPAPQQPPKGEAEAATDSIPVVKADRLRQDNPLG